MCVSLISVSRQLILYLGRLHQVFHVRCYSLITRPAYIENFDDLRPQVRNDRGKI